MKKFCLFLLFIISNFTYSQKNKETFFFDYNITYNTSRTINRTAHLIVNNNSTESIYFENKSKNSKNNTTKTNGRVKLTIIPKNLSFNYYNYTNNELVSKENIISKEYNVKEKAPFFKWNLIDSTKTINGIEVRCASTKFRGRKYIAWYSTKYAAKSGPWKFNGLPGLIVNIYDNTHRYEWNLSKVYSEKINFKNQKDSIINNNLTQISLKDFVDLKYNNDNAISKLKSKLPRGTKVSFIKTKRAGKELKYEWEK